MTIEQLHANVTVAILAAERTERDAPTLAPEAWRVACDAERAITAHSPVSHPYGALARFGAVMAAKEFDAALMLRLRDEYLAECDAPQWLVRALREVMP